jgi:hypothetical protein
VFASCPAHAFAGEFDALAFEGAASGRIRRLAAKQSPARPEGNWVVLISSNTADERLTTAHRAKLAYVYVRQYRAIGLLEAGR